MEADKGHYAAKHKDTSLDERIAAAVKGAAGEGKIACPSAEKLAAELAVSPAEIGRHADLLELRISGCQLGLFGHTSEEKAVRPAEEVSPDLETDIRGRLSGGKLPCAAAWEIAAKRGMRRIEVAAACEKLRIKVKPCQLGAF